MLGVRSAQVSRSSVRHLLSPSNPYPSYSHLTHTGTAMGSKRSPGTRPSGGSLRTERPGASLCHSRAACRRPEPTCAGPMRRRTYSTTFWFPLLRTPPSAAPASGAATFSSVTTSSRSRSQNPSPAVRCLRLPCPRPAPLRSRQLTHPTPVLPLQHPPLRLCRRRVEL